MQERSVFFRGTLFSAFVAGLLATLPSVAIGEQAAAPQRPGRTFVPGTVAEAKDKTISVFTRGPKSVSRATYQQKYLELHTFIGMAYTPNIIGYTVNLTTSEGGPDAITELWVPSWTKLFSEPWKPFLLEDKARIEADRRNWYDVTSQNFVVEEKVVKGEPLGLEPGRTPGVKLVWLFRRGEAVPPIPRGASRVVDNRVLHNPASMGADGTWQDGDSDIVLIRMAWAKDLAEIGPASAGAIVAYEWRNRPSPWK